MTDNKKENLFAKLAAQNARRRRCGRIRVSRWGSPSLPCLGYITGDRPPAGEENTGTG